VRDWTEEAVVVSGLVGGGGVGLDVGGGAFRVVLLGDPAFLDWLEPYLPSAVGLRVERLGVEEAERLPGVRLVVVDGERLSEELLERAVAEGWELLVVDRRGDVRRAVAWIKGGAAEYLFGSGAGESLSEAVASRYERWLSARREGDVELAPLPELVGCSAFARGLPGLIEKVARLPQLALLLSGESGVGKGLLARHIHRRSGCSGELIEVNCAVIPEGQLEAELFGEEPGGGAGYGRARRGLLELAAGGTLVLGEVGALPLPLQPLLLECIERRRFRRVGGRRELLLTARVVACTSEDLARRVEEGTFRKDLYFRLAVFPIRVPPLRERIEDVAPLAEHFVERYSRLYGLALTGLDAGARGLLLSRRWPGNVRELEHAVERAVILRERGLLREQDFALPAAGDGVGGEEFRIELGARGATLAEAERELIRLTLQRTAGNRSRAARLLGIPRSRLLRKIARYELEEVGR
jgi:DNA-binding NtrC family response regulator